MYKTPIFKIDNKIICYSATRHTFAAIKLNDDGKYKDCKINLDKYIPIYKKEIKKRLPKIIDLQKTKEINEFCYFDNIENIIIKTIPYVIVLSGELYDVRLSLTNHNRKVKMIAYKYTNNGLLDKNGVVKYLVHDKKILKEIFKANDNLLSKYVYSL